MSQLKMLSDQQSPQDLPWYAKGLRFQCTECGRCCSGSPGYVWLTEAEIQEIAHYLNLSLDEFGQRFLRLVNGRYALLEKIINPDVHDCVFLKDNKCTVYPVRPKQCRTFPWWLQNLTSPEDWQEAANHCEGISANAPLVSFESIQIQLNENREHDDNTSDQ